MKILILNWRDIKNPKGGGAEILTHELAKRWVKKGNSVILFSSKFKGAKLTELIDGVKIIRKGAWWNVHVFAFFYYLKNRNITDVIIDEVHWFPFFSALYARNKTVALTCEVANKLFFTLFPFPVAYFFRSIEKLYLRLYKNIPTMVISESTKNDLIKEGYNKKNIVVVPMGLTFPKIIKKYTKEKNPTFIFLARLNKQKGIYDVIDAFSTIKQDLPNSKIWIVGTGEEEVINAVKEKTKNYALEDSVKFFGFVTEQKKFELLARAHLLLVPSVHEGWGLTVQEAVTQKTPAIVYNVAGLRDIANNTKSTLILEKNTPPEMAANAIRILNNNKLYKQLQKKADSASLVTWDKTSEVALNVLESIE